MSDDLDIKVTSIVDRLKSVTPIVNDPTPVNTWTPIPLVGDIVEERPTILRLTDGRCLIYPGKTHLLFGASESGKTWLAIVAMSEVLSLGGRVLWIDYEDTKNTIMTRLVAYGVSREQWDRIDYVNPEGPLRGPDGVARTLGGAELDRLLSTHYYDLAVVDGLSTAMGVEGLDMNSANDVGLYNNRLTNVIARTGTAVITLTHVVKGGVNGDKIDSLGSGQWRAQVTGASYLVDCPKPFGKCQGAEPTYGTITLQIAKDRPATVRGGRGVLAKVAIAEVTARPDMTIGIKLSDPKDTVVVPHVDISREIVRHLRNYSGASMSGIKDNVTGKGERIAEAVAYLVDIEVITVTKVGASHRHVVDEVMASEYDF